MIKKCIYCQKEKSIDDFYDGAAKCKRCISEINHEKFLKRRPPINDLPGEVWRPINIAHLAPYYFISSFGRIKSNISLKLIKQGDRRGYLCVSLFDGKTYSSHRLVAKTFLPIDPERPWVNHKNGIKNDNRAENLEWCTQSENASHSFRTGLQSNRGDKNPISKLTHQQVVEIKKLLADGNLNQHQIGRKFNVTNHTICAINKGKNWSYVQ